jgi:hypothetical protein
MTADAACCISGWMTVFCEPMVRKAIASLPRMVWSGLA